MKQKTISKAILLNWIQFAEMHNINTSLMVQRLDVSEQDSIITFEQFALFAEWIIQKPEGARIGIRLGEQSNLAALGVVGQLIQSSRTIKEALEQASHFFNLISNVMHLDFHITKNHVLLNFEIDDDVNKKFPEVCEQLLIASMIFTYKEVYFLTLQNPCPTTVKITFESNIQEELSSLFNCEVQRSNRKNQLVFDEKIIDKKIKFSDYELMLHLEKLACQRLKEQNGRSNTFSDNIKSIVYNLLDPYFPNLCTVANQLNMSERTVQRKLKEEHTSYSRIITEMKKSIAKDYLKNNLSIKEVTYLLGYSEPSAFTNAFKGWFGESPKNYRTYYKNA